MHWPDIIHKEWLKFIAKKNDSHKRPLIGHNTNKRHVENRHRSPSSDGSGGTCLTTDIKQILADMENKMCADFIALIEDMLEVK